MIEVRDNIVPAYKVWIKSESNSLFLTELNIEDVFLLVDSICIFINRALDLVNRNTCVAPVLLCHSVGKQYCSLGFPRTYRRTGKLHSSCQKYSIISAKKIRLCVLYGMGNL